MASTIQLLESPIPTAAALSQKASSDDISGTKRGAIDPLVSKRLEKILNQKIKNGQNGLKWSQMVPNDPKWSQMIQNGPNDEKM